MSLFPVGLVTHFMLSTPVIKNGLVTGYYDGYLAGRKYPVDMAGLAVSVPLILSRPNSKFTPNPGFQETEFLESLEPFEIEAMANNCTQVVD